MPDQIERQVPPLLLSSREGKLKRICALGGEGLLFAIASLSVFAVLFIFYFIARDALFAGVTESGEPGLRLMLTWDTLVEFLTGNSWYPTHVPEVFGALSIFYGSLMVTVGACAVAVPLGICSSVALSDILPFSWRQAVKPVIELLASIPSVAYGFFALVVFAPALQSHGGPILAIGFLLMAVPIAAIVSVIIGGVVGDNANLQGNAKYGIAAAVFICFALVLALIANWFWGIEISSGTNALNVSIILGIMALPTIVSVSEDALQAVGPELRMGSYGLGATRAETLVLTVLPAASSGICAAVILGIMRALGETMVVWMAAGNSAMIPEPFYNFLSPVRTMTATIAGEMGETARNTPHYSILFLMALCLLLFCFVCNLASEWVMKRNRAKLRGEI